MAVAKIMLSAIGRLCLMLSFAAFNVQDMVDRPVRTRMPNGVGAGGEIPPATRLYSTFEEFPDFLY